MKERVISIIAIIGLLCACLFYQREFNKQRELKQEAYTSLRIANDSIKYFTNSKGQTVGQVQTNNVSVETFKQLYAGQITDLQQQVGNLKNLQAYVNAGLRANGRFSTIIRDSTIYDTVQVPSFAFSDGFLELTCALSDSAICQYSYTDSVSVLVRLRKPANWRWYNPISWFSKRQSVTEVSFKNPSAKATYIKSVLIKKEL